jgi:broad specificity phosphatase PhoE
VLIVVRHGRTEANARGVLLGRSDPPLDEVGREQAAAVGRALGPLAASGPVRVVSSPLQRTRATAEAVVEACGTVAGDRPAVEVDERWIELDYGEFEGRPTGSLPAEVWARWRSDPDFAPPGGESLRALRERVQAACDHWLAAVAPRGSGDGSGGAAGEPGGGVVVVVTHVSPVKATLGWALGLGDEVNWRAHVAPASITRVAPGPVLRSFNELGHLPADDG